MSDASISEMMFTMLSLLFLLLGIVLIVSILMSTINPYDQVTFANTEKLRAAMDQACNGQDVSIKFDMPQNVPVMTSIMPVTPIWIMNTNGDPNYVLYYESYPPGEAVGWEVYQQMQNRLVVELPDGWEGKNYDDVQNYVKTVLQKAREKNIGLIEGVVVNNILLNGKFRTDFYLGQKAELPADSGDVQQQQTENVQKFGAWSNINQVTNQKSDGDNLFKFNNYAGLNSFVKSSIKYMPCGANSLCLKTRDGVYSFPLRSCGDIKGVQMVYDARNRDKIWTTAGIGAGVGIACLFTGGTVCAIIGTGLRWTGWLGKSLLGIGWSVSKTLTIGAVTVSAYEGGKWVVGAFLAYKTQDFAIASPCSIPEMTISKAACKSAVPLDWAPDQTACAEDKVVKSTLYDFGSDDKLHAVGSHYTCAEKVSTDIDNPPATSFGETDQCLQIKIVESTSDSFCWTKDPYKSTMKLSDVDTEFLTWALGFTPVHSSLSYMNPAQSPAVDYVFVIKNYAMAKMESWGDFVERRIAWGWP